MPYERCVLCKRYDFTDHHTCPPKWRVWINDYHDTMSPVGGRVVAAPDAETAAEETIEHCNDEGQFIDADTLVMVKPEGRPGAEEWFEIRGEMVPHYSSTPTSPPAGHVPLVDECDEASKADAADDEE